jgi:hypothetical protein
MWEVALSERLSGALVLEDDRARERHIALEIAVRLPGLSLGGRIEAEPIARSSELSGQGSFDAGARAFRYLFHFRADDGRALSMSLARQLHVANLYTSITVLTGEIDDPLGGCVARCLLRFDARQELSRSISSLRLSRRLRR